MKNIPTIFFIVLVVSFIIGLFYIIYPFIIPIILAILLAHFFYPIKTFFLSKKLTNGKATFLTFLIALFFVIWPLVGISILVSAEARNFYRLFTEFFASNDNNFYAALQQTTVFKILENRGLIDAVSNLIDADQLKEQIISIANKTVNWLVNSLRSLLVNIPTFIINVFIWIYLSYFLILNGKYFFNQVKSFLPIAKDEQGTVINEVIKMIDATLIGTFVVGLIEGILGGLIFLLVGIPGAITWGVFMAILSMIPVVGANGILLPAAIYFLASGNLSVGLVILIFGSGSVAVIEYILKPKFMGDKAGVHPSIVAVAILGGIYRMGLLGFIVGPVIATVAIASLQLFKHKLKTDSAKTQREEKHLGDPASPQPAPAPKKIPRKKRN